MNIQLYNISIQKEKLNFCHFLQHGWEKNLDVMLLGASRGVYTAIERMGKSKGGKGGRIVNVASVAGLTVSTFKKMPQKI